MSIITLTTDYGNKDYFVSSLKAKLISDIDEININWIKKILVDLTNYQHKQHKLNFYFEEVIKNL